MNCIRGGNRSFLRGLAFATLPVVALGGCGGGQSDEETARNLTESLLTGDPGVCENVGGDLLYFLGGKGKCAKSVRTFADQEGLPKIENVAIQGSKATVTAVRDNERGLVRLVNRDGDWTLTEIVAGPPTAAQRRELAAEAAARRPKFRPTLTARQAADAYYEAIRAGDGRAFCGLISAREARDVIGEPDAKQPIADCVQALMSFDWSKASKEARRVTSTAVSTTGGSAVVSLSDGRRAKLERYDGRWVVDNVTR